MREQVRKKEAEIGVEKNRGKSKREKSPTIDIDKILNDARFDELDIPPSMPAVAKMGGVDVLWRGNVHTLVAASKAGKTRLVASLIKASITHKRELGWTCDAGLIAGYFDFEQDLEDFHDAMKNQAGATKFDVCAFNLAGLSSLQSLQCVEHALKQGEIEGLAIIDGVADLCANINDPEEANDLVAGLMHIAREYKVAILLILHLNPGSDVKSRGHLGSQLERKSKTVLQVDVDPSDDTRVIYTRFSRKRPILKSEGVRFKWCNDAYSFIEIGSISEEKRDGDIKDYSKMMKEIMRTWTEDFITYTSLVSEVMNYKSLKDTTAKNHIKNMTDWGVITKDHVGYYQISEKQDTRNS